MFRIYELKSIYSHLLDLLRIWCRLKLSEISGMATGTFRVLMSLGVSKQVKASLVLEFPCVRFPADNFTAFRVI
jgi:hypothetical protein